MSCCSGAGRRRRWARAGGSVFLGAHTRGGRHLTTIELESEVADLEGLLTMAMKTRKDRIKARKVIDVG
ncbi:hypothetical protein FIBSPDRAFT_849094 [Athelia psychrophila]|uniref:Uncharacterized protein n=1 Tax=Athelia psychrophila TaxID=1759441 RepID=A0A166UWM6_9AGAM|nr:hypothetical protein FIBSPDRAFT_849094 [Fibularhizoctonia sp. CBS 109695]